MTIRYCFRLFFSMFILAIAGMSVGAQNTQSADTSCSSVNWNTGVSYAMGTVAYYQPTKSFYKVVQVGTQGSNGSLPTDASGTWSLTSSCTGTAWPNKIIGGYYPNWAPAPPRIAEINPNYNLIYLFSAIPKDDGLGEVTFALPNDTRGARTNFVADLAYVRKVQGRRVLLSVGGSHGAMSFPDRAHSQAFVDSIAAIYSQLGGFDGLDWDNYEGSQSPSTEQMIWISKQLKAKYQGFLITTPPAPWSTVDLQFCQMMLEAGALDFAGLQFYDGDGLASPANIERETSTWVSALGASHVVVGFGVLPDTANYETIDVAVSTWKSLVHTYPDLLGTFDWQLANDQEQSWVYADQIAPLVK